MLIYYEFKRSLAESTGDIANAFLLEEYLDTRFLGKFWAQDKYGYINKKDEYVANM